MKLALDLIAAALLATGALPALANLALATQRACTSCHAVDKKLVGPAYKDVAKKYAGRKDAAAVLANSIRQGGAGRWGVVAMPPQPKLSEADLKALAEWVLSTK